MLHVHSMSCTAVVTGRDTGLPTVPSGTPGPTATPLCGLRGQTGSTFHLLPHTCKPGHTTLPSQAAHPWLLRCVLAADTKGARYRHNQCTTAASSALICVPYIKVHPLYHPPLCHRGSQPSQPLQSFTPKLPLLSPKALAATSPPSPSSLSRQMATTKQLSFPGSWEDGERGEVEHIRIGCLFFFKGIKRGEFLFDSQLP